MPGARICNKNKEALTAYVTERTATDAHRSWFLLEQTSNSAYDGRAIFTARVCRSVGAQRRR